MALGFYLGLAVAISSALKLSFSQAVCSLNQYKLITASGFKCIDCPRCPAGYGLLLQCGTNIHASRDNATIKCELCKEGHTYSSQYDYEQCQKCGVCSDDQVMTQCTSQANTLCHKRCKSKENYFESSTDDCQKCSWCCEDGEDIVKDECIKKGMPSRQSCTVHHHKKCAPAITTSTPLTTIKVPITDSSEQPTGIIMNRTTSKAEPTHAKSSSSTLSILGIIFSIIAGIGLGIAIKCVWKYLKRSSVHFCCMNERRQGIELPESTNYNPTAPIEEPPCTTNANQPHHGGIQCDNGQLAQTTIDDPTASLIEEPPPISTINQPRHVEIPAFDEEVIGADILLFNWLDAHQDVKENICDHLDLNNSFADMARYFKMKEVKVRKLLQNPGDHPTETVLEFVQSSYNPNLTIHQFIIVCTNHIKRIDVSDIIKSAIMA